MSVGTGPFVCGFSTGVAWSGSLMPTQWLPLHAWGYVCLCWVWSEFIWTHKAFHSSIQFLLNVGTVSLLHHTVSFPLFWSFVSVPGPIACSNTSCNTRYKSVGLCKIHYPLMKSLHKTVMSSSLEAQSCKELNKVLRHVLCFKHGNSPADFSEFPEYFITAKVCTCRRSNPSRVANGFQKILTTSPFLWLDRRGLGGYFFYGNIKPWHRKGWESLTTFW